MPVYLVVQLRLVLAVRVPSTDFFFILNATFTCSSVGEIVHNTTVSADSINDTALGPYKVHRVNHDCTFGRHF